jgi:hypothetical protein
MGGAVVTGSSDLGADLVTITGRSIVRIVRD